MDKLKKFWEWFVKNGYHEDCLAQECVVIDVSTMEWLNKIEIQKIIGYKIEYLIEKSKDIALVINYILYFASIGRLRIDVLNRCLDEKIEELE